MDKIITEEAFLYLYGQNIVLRAAYQQLQGAVIAYIHFEYQKGGVHERFMELLAEGTRNSAMALFKECPLAHKFAEEEVKKLLEELGF